MDHEKLKQHRHRAIERAKQAGIPAYFLDEDPAVGVIRVLPDGRAERISACCGEPVICTARFVGQAAHCSHGVG
jgi:hypothetical protein